MTAIIDTATARRGVLSVFTEFTASEFPEGLAKAHDLCAILSAQAWAAPQFVTSTAKFNPKLRIGLFVVVKQAEHVVVVESIAALEKVELDCDGDQAFVVGIAHALSVKGSQTYTIGGSRDVTTVGDFSIGTASESVSVGGLRSFQVGGDYETTAATLLRSVGAVKAEVAIQEVNRHVSGVSTIAVGGSWNETGGLTSSVSVLGASALTVGGPLSINAKDYALSASLLSETYAAKPARGSTESGPRFGGAAAKEAPQNPTVPGWARFRTDGSVASRPECLRSG